MSRSVLYLGFQTGTAQQRANAFARLGWQVRHINSFEYIPPALRLPALFNRLGQFSLPAFVERGLLAEIAEEKFDLVWVDGGPLIGPSLLKKLSSKKIPLVNYNHDDPFGMAEGNKWKVYLRAVPYYDMLVVVRKENVEEARTHGARRVELVFRSYDPIIHSPREMTEEEKKRWQSEVLFVGTWKPERGSFFKRLAQKNIPVSIYGDCWNKAREFSDIKHLWKGASLHGDDYTKAIQSSRVCLGLLFKENRDLHTTRSLEIPAIGGLFCAERTSEHSFLYEENKEALFWNTPEECAQVCQKALDDPAWASTIAHAGQQKVRALQLSHDEVISSILKKI